MRSLCLLLMMVGASSAVVVLDRMAVIVGKHVIKTSDIDWDLRVTAFLNREPLDFSSPAKRKSAERLIDQEIIRQEIVTGNYRRPADSDAAALETQLKRDRFAGSDQRMRAESVALFRRFRRNFRRSLGLRPLSLVLSPGRGEGSFWELVTSDGRRAVGRAAGRRSP